MKGHDFKRWRKSLSLSQREAADQLGLKRRVVQYYEKGERDGKNVKIPRTVRLACYALTLGVPDYQGPEKVKGRERTKDIDLDAPQKEPKKTKPAKEKKQAAKDKPAKQRAKDREKEREREWAVAAGVSTKGSKKQKPLDKPGRAKAKSAAKGNGHDALSDDFED